MREEMTVRSHNPVLSRRDTFGTPTAATLEEMYSAPQRMTIDDVVGKTALLLGILSVTAAASWVLELYALAFPAAIVGFVLALVLTFKREPSPGLTIAYAAIEGVFLGAVSRLFDEAYPGIAVQAIGGTILCFGAVLWAYKSGRLRATPRFKKVITIAMMSIFALYMVNLLVSLFGVDAFGFIRDSGPVGILFSVFVVSIAALSFVLDFDMIEDAERHGVPEKFAWKAAFGLVVGLVWLYLELLRLLSKLRD
ncbi:MAG TPA: Bax inhibitor-1/YccA family protein [Frankiaceae bacterium]|nr:Bax inhibitor-1/YccA family protein [Frankiaceae bacterium]